MISIETLENYKVRFDYIEDNITKGSILVEETIDIINIVDVFVESEYRRQGIASEIMKYITLYYKGKKEKMMLEVRVSNTPAINLYEKCGFVKIYTRDKYYKEEDAYIMEMKL